MRRSNNLFAKITSIDNLLLAFHNAKKGCSNKKYVEEYNRNIFENICLLKKKIETGLYEFGKYRYFEIFEPKRRIISVAPFENRVVHHAIINICKNDFERHFIFDTYANRKNKGMLAAVYRAQKMAAKYSCVVKLDIRKYFDSISHVILKEKLKRLFKDKRLLVLLDKTIDSYCSKTGYGLPIGNLTSQYFANFYLSFCDHYAKEILQVPSYVRYMDDMLVFSNSRKQIKVYICAICEYLSKELELKTKSPQLISTINGIPFLGYRIYGKRLMLNSKNKRNFRLKFTKYNRLYIKGIWNDLEFRTKFDALMAFVQKADTFGLRSLYCNKLYSSGH